jgi:hypothetical protein
VKRLLWSAAVLAAAVAITTVVSLPPARIDLPSAADGTVPGILHIHTNRSDGGSGPDDIAVAASHAGLKFIVFTDHGDGTRAPDPPAYRSGVLCIDAVEISTTAGHYVALGMPPAPYPLGGEPRDVVEDVRRLGGFGIAAHPDSPKDGLRWGDWTARVDGVEIINPDTSWRARVLEPGIRGKFNLLTALATYPIRPEETIADLLGEPSSLLDRWDMITPRRMVVGIAGVDAHAKLSPFDLDPGDNRYALPFPGYETVFRTLSVRVTPDHPLTGDAVSDAESLLGAVRSGHLYTAVDAIASPASFEFTASSGTGTAKQGGELQSADGTMTLHVKSNAPASFATTVWHGRRALATRREPDFTVTAPSAPGAYRVEIRATDRTGDPLWIVSNPIYVRGPVGLEEDPIAANLADGGQLFPAEPFGWSVEHDPASKADLEVLPGQSGPEMRFRYTLGSDPAVRPGVAIAAPPAAIAPNNRLALTIRSEHPMRLAVQLRGGSDPSREERWQRSVYVDQHERQVVIDFGEMIPVGSALADHPPLDQTPSVVLMVDTANAKPGSSGAVWIRRAAFQRRM